MSNIDALDSLVCQPHETNGSFTHELDTLFFITSTNKTQFHSKNKQGGRKSNLMVARWRSGRDSDSQPEGREFESSSGQCVYKMFVCAFSMYYVNTFEPQPIKAEITDKCTRSVASIEKL